MLNVKPKPYGKARNRRSEEILIVGSTTHFGGGRVGNKMETISFWSRTVQFAVVPTPIIEMDYVAIIEMDYVAMD